MKPQKEIIVNSSPFETRVAVVEGSKLIEIYVERTQDRVITGNVYKGTVVRVLPGMQAAFVEVGLDRTSFLHASDIKGPYSEDSSGEGEGEGAEDVEIDVEVNVEGDASGDVDVNEDDGGESKEISAAEVKKGGRGRPRKVDRGPASRIQDVLKSGHQVLVQVAKEPIGTKGARVTSHVSLPGRYLVFMPTYDKIAVSRRIENEKERRRLKKLVSRVKPEGAGFIVRTVCEGMTEEHVKADMDYLVKLWNTIDKKAAASAPPALLYEELDLTLRTIRDLFSEDYDRFVIDSEEEYNRASSFIDDLMPHLSGKLEHYTGDEPIFDAFGLEMELSDALQEKVWLRSGGHIVIDQMEALTAIDVNTGKYVGKKSSEETVLKTNLEAAEEVVHQLRLRNIGGIIVIDFIDMMKHENRRKVYNALRDALKIDKARTNILKVSELGIVEMTRKRVRESIGQALCETCPYCDGNGLVKSRDTVIMELYRELKRELPHRRRKAVVYVNPDVAERLKEDTSVLDDLQARFKKKVVIKMIDTFHREQFEIV